MHQAMSEAPASATEQPQATPPTATSLMTKKQLAEYLHVHPRTITRKVTEGLIPSIRIGSCIRFDLNNVLEALQGGDHAGS